MAEDYSATTHMLKDYFNWSRDETPNFYVKLSMRAWKKVYGVKEKSVDIGSPTIDQRREVPEKKSTYELFMELQSKD